MGANVFVIIGDDDYLVDCAAKKIYGKGIGLEVIDSVCSANAEAQLADIGRADSSFMEPPFLDPEKTTWWKNVHFLPSGGKKSSSEEVKESLERFAQKLASGNLPSNQRFILSCPNLLLTSVVAKTLKKGAEIIEVGFRGNRNARSFANSNVVKVIDFASGIGLKFEQGAAEAFVGVVGPNSRSQIGELEKLKTYLCGKSDTVSLKDIHAVCSPGAGIEPVVWNVTDALAERDAAKAISAMKKFEGENGFGVMMSNAIEKCFRQLALVKDAVSRGAESELSGQLSPWQIDKLSSQASKWSLLELRCARHRMMKLREGFVSGVENAAERLEIEIAQMCAKGIK